MSADCYQSGELGSALGDDTKATYTPEGPLSPRPKGAGRLSLLPLHRVMVVSLAMTYAVLLIAILRWIISRVFTYEGYAYHPIMQLGLWLWVWGLILLVACVLPIQVSKPSQFFAWLFFLVVFVPATLIPPYAAGLRMEYAPYQVVLFASMLLFCGVGLLPILRLPSPTWSLRAYVVCLLAYSTIIMLWLVIRVGFPTSIPSFADAYVQRSAFGAAIGSAGAILYLISWQTSVVNPLLVLIGLSTKRWTIILTGIGLSVLMYSMAGHKSHLLSSVLVIAVFLLFGVASRLRGILVSMGAIVMIVASALLYAVSGAIYPVSIAVRRLIMVPGLLTGHYFVYFSENGFTQRFGPLSLFLNPKDMDLSTPRTIGLEFFDTADIAANANFLADGFSSLGLVGMGLATLILVLVLWITDVLSVTRSNLITTPLFVVVLFSLTNSALPTSLLTHGILFAILMIWLLPIESRTNMLIDCEHPASEPLALRSQ